MKSGDAATAQTGDGSDTRSDDALPAEDVDAEEGLEATVLIEAAAASRRAHPEDFVPLFQGSFTAKLRSFLSEPWQPRTAYYLSSSSPSDFSPGRYTYLAESHALAVYYARLKGRMVNEHVQAGVLTVLVKKEQLEALVLDVDGDDWKKFVYYNRTKSRQGLEKGLGKYGEANVLRGLTSGGNNKTFKGKTGWEAVKEIAAPGVFNKTQVMFKGMFKSGSAYPLLELAEAVVTKL